MSSQDNHLAAWIGRVDLREQLFARHSGHHEISQDDIETAQRKKVERTLADRRRVDREALLTECFRSYLALEIVVFNH
jgi:hypothetical protein